MKAKRQMVTIKLKDGGTAEVKALVLGDIAIHKTWLAPSKAGDFYCLTYVPNGRTVLFGVERQRLARAIAEAVVGRTVTEDTVVAIAEEEAFNACYL